MTPVVAYGVALLSLAAGGYALWHVLRDRALGNPLFYAVAAVEIVLLAVLVGAVVALLRTERDVDGVLFVSYLLTVAVIPPAATLWGIAEKSRWGTGVVAVAMVTVAALMARILGIWEAA